MNVGVEGCVFVLENFSSGGIGFKSTMLVFEKVLSENMRGQIFNYFKQLRKKLKQT